MRLFNKFSCKFLNFKEDPFGTVLLDLSYLLMLLTFSTLPLFTTRNGFTTITNVLSISTCAIIAIYIIFRGKIYINYFVFLTIIFVIYATIMTCVGSKSFLTLKSVITLYGLSIFVFQFCANTNDYHFFGFVLLLGISLLALFFMIEYMPELLSIIKGKQQIGRMGSKYGNLNYVGRNFVLGSLICTSIAFYKKRLYFLFLIGTIVMGVCVFLTGSRGALLILVTGLAVSTYFLFPRKLKWLFFVSLVLIAGIFIGLLQLPFLSGLKNSFLGALNIFTNDGKQDSSASRRIIMLKDALYIWTRNPLFGFGADGFESQSGYGTYCHNSVGEILCCFGIVGLLLFYIPIVLMIKDLLKDDNKSPFLIISSVAFLVAFLLVGLFFFVLYLDKILVLMLALLFSSDFGLNKSNQKHISFRIIKKNLFLKKHIA